MLALWCKPSSSIRLGMFAVEASFPPPRTNFNDCRCPDWTSIVQFNCNLYQFIIIPLHEPAASNKLESLIHIMSCQLGWVAVTLSVFRMSFLQTLLLSHLRSDAGVCWESRSSNMLSSTSKYESTSTTITITTSDNQFIESEIHGKSWKPPLWFSWSFHEYYGSMAFCVWECEGPRLDFSPKLLLAVATLAWRNEAKGSTQSMSGGLLH